MMIAWNGTGDIASYQLANTRPDLITLSNQCFYIGACQADNGFIGFKGTIITSTATVDTLINYNWAYAGGQKNQPASLINMTSNYARNKCRGVIYHGGIVRFEATPSTMSFVAQTSQFNSGNDQYAFLNPHPTNTGNLLKIRASTQYDLALPTLNRIEFSENPIIGTPIHFVSLLSDDTQWVMLTIEGNTAGTYPSIEAWTFTQAVHAYAFKVETGPLLLGLLYPTKVAYLGKIHDYISPIMAKTRMTIVQKGTDYVSLIGPMRKNEEDTAIVLGIIDIKLTEVTEVPDEK